MHFDSSMPFVQLTIPSQTLDIGIISWLRFCLKSKIELLLKAELDFQLLFRDLPWSETTEDVSRTHQVFKWGFFILTVRTVGDAVTQCIARNAFPVGTLVISSRTSRKIGKWRCRSSLGFAATDFITAVSTLRHTVTQLMTVQASAKRATPSWACWRWQDFFDIPKSISQFSLNEFHLILATWTCELRLSFSPRF